MYNFLLVFIQFVRVTIVYIVEGSAFAAEFAFGTSSNNASNSARSILSFSRRRAAHL